MSRKITINSVVHFEPEKKRISGEKGIYTISASAALCLELLIDNIGNLVTHDQLYEYAWRRFGMEPTSTSLYQNISTIRKSLSRSGMKQDIIRTMPRRGFLLSPLTEIYWHGPELILEEDDNDEERTGSNPDENSSIINETESFATNALRPLMPIAPKSHILKRSYKKFSWLLAILSGLAMGILTYFIKINTQHDTIFHSKPLHYKEFTIFSNKGNDFQDDEIFSLINGLDLKHENNRLAYITGYRFSDRISIILCRNPLGDKEVTECHSVYYIKNMRK